MDKLINGELTFDDYEEMFYQFAKPLKRLNRIPTSVSAVGLLVANLGPFWFGQCSKEMSLFVNNHGRLPKPANSGC